MLESYDQRNQGPTIMCVRWKMRNVALEISHPKKSFARVMITNLIRLKSETYMYLRFIGSSR